MSTKILRLLVLIVFTVFDCFVPVCGATVPIGTREVTLVPNQMKDLLLHGTDSQRAQLSLDLHLAIPRRTRHGAKNDVPCTDIDSVESSVVTLRHPGPQAVLLIIASLSCHSAFLVVLEPTGRNSWRDLDTLWLWAKNRIPRVEYQSLIQSDEKEIIIWDNETVWGTGTEMTDLVILKLFGEGLEVIFDEPEHVIFAQPIDKEHSIDQREDSDFTFVLNTPERNVGPSLRSIFEKQIITGDRFGPRGRENHSTITRWWQDVWVPELRVFRRYPTWGKP